MATDATPEEQPAGEAIAPPPPCSPCRGTGKVISNLGGSPQTVECPWCEGTGTFIADHDAQAHHRTDAAEGAQTEQTASPEPTDSSD